MISTYSQCKQRVLDLLDDPGQGIFKDPIILAGLGEAVDALNTGFILYEIPRLKIVGTFIIPAMTKHLYPADIVSADFPTGISDFGDLISMEERASGSKDKFIHVWETDDLTQRDPVEILGEFEWRTDQFWWIGSTQAREIRLAYFTTTEELTDFSGSSTIDMSLTFLSKYTAGIIGRRKDDPNADTYWTQAVGTRYDDGIIGGELFRIIQHRLRGRQRVQVAPKPYSVIRRTLIRRPPYIAAVQPAGGIGMPAVFDTVNGTITPLPDGFNDTFYLSYPVNSISLSRNGSTLTQPIDYQFGGNQIVFVQAQIPGVGDNLRAEGWGNVGAPPNNVVVNVTSPPSLRFGDPAPLPDGVTFNFLFSDQPVYLIYNGQWRTRGIGFLLSGTQNHTATLIDNLGATIIPAVDDTLQAVF